jgi:hypothetical protein
MRSSVLVMIAACWSPLAVANCPREWRPGFEMRGMDDTVYTLLSVSADGIPAGLYAGGDFEVAGDIGYWRMKIARWDGERWQALGGEVNGRVDALAAFDPPGEETLGLYAAGEFSVAGGVQSAHIARWDGAAWFSVGGGVSGNVYGVAVYDDGYGPALYAGGEFQSAGGVSASRIAEWDGAQWSALGTGLNGFASALAVYDDGTGPALYVAGTFTRAGGIAAYNIARWDGQSWSDVGIGVGGSYYGVRALAVYDDGSGPALYAAGEFEYAGSVPANRVAKWNGSEWSALGSGLNYDAYALAVYDDGSGAGLYVGGQFTTAGDAPAAYVARWDGTSWSGLGDGTDSWVYALATFDPPGAEAPGLYAGGEFSVAGGLGATGIARWDGAAWSALGSGNGLAGRANVVRVLDLGNGPALYAGGGFAAAGASPANAVARWDGQGWSALDGGLLGGVVNGLKTYDHADGLALYATGKFGRAGDQNARNIARWGGGAWAALGSGIGTSSEYGIGLCVFDPPGAEGPGLYAAGRFTVAGGLAVNNIARWDGVAWSDLAGGLTSAGFSAVVAVCVFDDGAGSALYAGGNFTRAGGLPTAYIARWDGAAWSGLNGQPDDVVQALAVFDDGRGPALYVGGGFQSVGDVEALGIARWDGAAWSPVGGGVTLDDPPGWPGVIEAMTVFDTGDAPMLYVAGEFDRAGGLPAPSVACWDGRRWRAVCQTAVLAPQSIAGFDDGSGPALFVSGTFLMVGDMVSAYIAKLGCVPGLTVGDTNCNGVVDNFDIHPFVLALCRPEEYAAQYPNCDPRTADTNRDGLVNDFDITPFVHLLTGP